ncbi:MAG: VOC family protein [Cyanobacteria bacterium P01_G01_bin.4]
MTTSPSISASSSSASLSAIPLGHLRGVHHIALNVADLERSLHFYRDVLGLKELTGAEVPSTLQQLVADGKVSTVVTPDGTIFDLFATPDLSPPHPDPAQEFTRANHVAFDIDPAQFDAAVASLQTNDITIASGPVTRPTGRGIYFYDPDGFLLEIRCDPA